MSTIRDLLLQATETLTFAGVAQPSREATSLMCWALSRDRAFIVAHPEYQPTPSEIVQFADGVDRRALREPLQYIRRSQEFLGLEFEVTWDVLIPRPETELLVEHAAEVLRAASGPSFLEVGAGSGCISISLLHDHQQARATAVDISPAALEVARRNAERHGVSDRLDLIVSNVYSAVEPKAFDVIVSNPPYVPSGELSNLQAEVKDYEPHISLVGGVDGLYVMTAIISDAPKYLSKAGFLFLEIGYDQAERVLKLFDPRVWADSIILSDLQGIPRTVKAQLR